MTETPVVSAIMTVYNGEQYVAQAIESLQQQSLRDIEIVVVDDGSSDHTPDILASIQATDSRIRVITKPRIGRARALNVAWRQAQGKYIANLDADDMAEPERLEKQLSFLQQHPEVGVLGAACKVLDKDNGETYFRYPPTNDMTLKHEIIRRNPFVHSVVMMPRQALERIGGYDEQLGVAIDYDLWIRIACHYKLANLPEVLVIKRMHNLAYFRNNITNWQRYVTLSKILWFAWRHLSRRVTDLRYVILNPLRIGLYNSIRRLRTMKH